MSGYSSPGNFSNPTQQTQSIKCHVCRMEYQGNFCPQCGTAAVIQKSNPKWWLPCLICAVLFSVISSLISKNVMLSVSITLLFVSFVTLVISIIFTIINCVTGAGRKWIKPMLITSVVVVVLSFIATGLSPDKITINSQPVLSAPKDEAYLSPTVTPHVESEAEYKSSTESYAYEDIARNPQSYAGNRAKFTGQVIQVVEDGRHVTMRVNVTKDDYEFWSDTILVDYERKTDTESRILEDDIITVFGEIDGLTTYTSIFNEKISIPLLEAKYLDIQD